MEGGRSRQVGVLTAVAKNARSRSESEWRVIGAVHKSGTHRLGGHKQAEGWNVLALSNSKWKLPNPRTEVRRR